MNAAPQIPVENLSFEEALEELENLTAKMASGTVTLRESGAAYERGAALFKRCQSELEAARTTIERLRKDGALRSSEAAGAPRAEDDGSAPF